MIKSKTILYIFLFILFIVSTPLIICLCYTSFLTPEIVELKKTSTNFNDSSSEEQAHDAQKELESTSDETLEQENSEWERKYLKQNRLEAMRSEWKWKYLKQNRFEAMRKEMDRQGLMNKARQVATEAVRETLISPYSAHFSDVTVSYRISNGGVFCVEGNVDAQNVYGAMLRHRFKRYVKRNGERLIDISDSLSDEELMDYIKAWSAELKEEAEWLQKRNKLIQEILDSP